MTPVAAALLLASAVQERSVPPLPTPPAFATREKGLTFRTPPNASYCPLPDDWVGSDHGTTLFLTPPRHCAGDVGYPSSARGFTPEWTPRVEVYYGYWDAEIARSRSTCRSPIKARLFAQETRLCRIRRAAGETFSAAGHYRANSAVEVIFTLVTTQARRNGDVTAFRRLLASARMCSSIWHSEDASGHRNAPDSVIGTGARCPVDARFF